MPLVNVGLFVADLFGLFVGDQFGATGETVSLKLCCTCSFDTGTLACAVGSLVCAVGAVGSTLLCLCCLCGPGSYTKVVGSCKLESTVVTGTVGDSVGVCVDKNITAVVITFVDVIVGNISNL